MAKSKFKKGFKVTMLTVSGNTAQAGIATIMQSELKPLGIDLTIRPVDGTTEFELQQKETYQMVLEAGTGDNIDPNENMEFCCISNGGADSGYTGWHDPAADALYAKSQKQMNKTLRAQELSKWQQMIMQQGPFIWVVYPTNSFAYKTASTTSTSRRPPTGPSGSPGRVSRGRVTSDSSSTSTTARPKGRVVCCVGWIAAVERSLEQWPASGRRP